MGNVIGPDGHLLGVIESDRRKANVIQKTTNNSVSSFRNNISPIPHRRNLDGDDFLNIIASSMH
jgi:hypothetical protein